MSNRYSLHQAPPGSRDDGRDGGGPVETTAGTRGDLAALEAALEQAEAALARAVIAAGRLAGSGVCEQQEGLPLERFVSLAVRWSGRDARALVGIGEVLGDMPVLAGLVEQGQVSYSQARAVAGGLGRLGRAARATVDERIGATIAARGGVDGYDPDGLVDAVADAVADCREQRAATRQDQRARASNYLQLQPGLDGRVQLFGDCDALAGAVIINALDAAAGTPTNDDGDHAHHHDDDRDDDDAGAGAGAGLPEGVAPTRRGRAYADALTTIASHYLAGASDTERAAAATPNHPNGAGTTNHPNGADPAGGSGTGTGTDDAGGAGAGGSAAGAAGGSAAGASSAGPAGAGAGRRARPLVIAHVQLSQLFGLADGRIELNTRGGYPRVSAATIEALAASGDVRAVVFDGARPLAVTDKIAADHIPAATRTSVRARDRGCRLPGSRDPIGHTDLHHLTARAAGGDHHPDNLVALSRRWHTRVHHHHWHLTLDPDSGQLTIRRGDRQWHSLPPGTPLEPAPAPPEPEPPPDPPDPPQDNPEDNHEPDQHDPPPF
ncbi:HNH endonuclease [Egibacter rhizosphaerae]|uniref:HNH endonuclease n=1 Tax=Egibacter rhizosphaerae TaxID=1670831 RepID=A0A411YF59_9ACTN|nr:HNH endonuclease signature motif containing protein [Egibacter rhizosphaerae]QBI19752.1 HNH endonuclease [Egibacter rhizosphaerae]